MNESNILEILKKIRNEKKLKQEDMAKHLRMSRQSYSDLETGKTTLSLLDFLTICKILNIDPITIVKESEDIIVVLNNDQADAIGDLNNQIQQQKYMNNIRINKNTGNIFINSSNNKIEK